MPSRGLRGNSASTQSRHLPLRQRQATGTSIFSIEFCFVSHSLLRVRRMQSGLLAISRRGLRGRRSASLFPPIRCAEVRLMVCDPERGRGRWPTERRACLEPLLSPCSDLVDAGPETGARSDVGAARQRLGRIVNLGCARIAERCVHVRRSDLLKSLHPKPFEHNEQALAIVRGGMKLQSGRQRNVRREGGQRRFVCEDEEGYCLGIRERNNGVQGDIGAGNPDPSGGGCHKSITVGAGSAINLRCHPLCRKRAARLVDVQAC